MAIKRALAIPLACRPAASMLSPVLYQPIKLQGLMAIRGLSSTQTIFVGRATTGTARRFYSVISEECKAKLYNYPQIKKLTQAPNPDSIIVDVREPVEYEEGHIPGAINIPFKSSPGALGLNAEEFEENFGFKKPDADKELIFYCLAGIRSTAAEDLAKTFGYKKRGNYVGSYEDWVANEIKKDTVPATSV
ncbi:Rhodanese-domain-containing protein [Yamadazyma tenuis ATCC 10573]|uniref:Rhodanese-domain-containing protein n=2 Tax=Candida tenuis TaxID=2315449 RepID=G3B856_CANTC|nr:Rhodanese-domain-containing protein [Yamadazyma tenuis ATCC 10573]EGV62353.1 Rhodanese-domain-containing protein [Yamadazyma tenuis ATCC 10573]